MTGQTATQTPTGFHIMMPPGWVRYLVDDEGKRALLRQTSARMRDLSRPDLDAQARTLVEGQWRKLITSGVTAVYLPVETTEILPPARALFDWWARERDPDGDGLVSILQPDESGLDACPKYDRLLRMSEPGDGDLRLAMRRLFATYETLATDRGIRCVTLDYDQMRGMDSDEFRLF